MSRRLCSRAPRIISRSATSALEISPAGLETYPVLSLFPARGGHRGPSRTGCQLYLRGVTVFVALRCRCPPPVGAGCRQASTVREATQAEPRAMGPLLRDEPRVHS